AFVVIFSPQTCPDPSGGTKHTKFFSSPSFELFFFLPSSFELPAYKTVTHPFNTSSYAISV
ncbi:MAG: hypothetical protein ACQESL_06530, partial [Bacteroidota bacterium]